MLHALRSIMHQKKMPSTKRMGVEMQTVTIETVDFNS